jgi:acyl transferase domain-containing protein
MVTSAATIPIFSTVLARRAEGHEFGASYWSSNLRQPVLFTDAVGRMLDEGITAFVELGPHPVLLPSVQQTAQALERSVATVACGRREEPEWVNILAAVGTLWATGYPIDWRHVLPATPRHVTLPLHPWQRERHWLSLAEVEAAGPTRQRTGRSITARHPLLGAAIELAGTPPGHLWEPQLNLLRSPFLGEHQLHGAPVLAASVYVELALAAARALDRPAVIESLTFEQALYLNPDSPAGLQMRAQPDGATISLTWHSEAGERWIRHASARLSDSRESTDVPVMPPHQGGRVCDGAVFYASLATRGVLFSGSLRSIARAGVGDTHAWAELAAPPSASAPRNLEVAPWMLDACFQLAAASRPGDELWLPSSVGRIRHWPQNGSPERIDVRVRDTGAEGTQELDITLQGEHGTLLQLDSVLLRRLTGKAPADPHRWLHRIEWVEADRLPASEDSTDRAFVILGDRAGVDQALAKGLRASARSAVVAEDAALDEQGLAQLIANASAGARRVDVVLMRGLDLGDTSVPSIQGSTDMVRAVRALDRIDTVSRRLWVVTCGARAVRPEDAASIAAGQAALWGLGSAVATEHQALWGGCLDLDPSMSVGEQAQWLHDELIGGQSGDAAVRAGKRLVPALTRLDATAPARRFELRPDAAYLLTGGLGGVGTQVARWLVERGARRLVICGRTALPARAEWAVLDPSSRAGRAVAAIRALESCGAAIHYSAVDVGDEASLRGAIETYRAEQWPDIAGVIHAAGVIDDRLLTEVDSTSLSRVFAGKANGAWNLHRLFPRLDFFVLFSSVAALIAQPGQGSYSAANAFLDALAHRRRGEGQSALSVNWGVWQGLGFADTAGGAQAQEQLSRLGFNAFTAAAGLTALGVLVEQPVAQAAVLPLDAVALRHAIDQRTLAGSAAALLRTLAEAPVAVTTDSPREESFVSQLLQEPAPRQRQLLEERLVRHVAAVLRLGVGKLDRRTPLGSYGLNSLMALELRNRIESDLNVQLVATVLWNYPTILALAEYLRGRLAPTTPVIDHVLTGVESPTESSQPLTDAAATIEAMSDDEALAALARATPGGRGPR